mmetsp:Transcript_31594/g.72105  ORF Transcript_31594/g.72105 Transcript_31594/m.72105 type:complete len:125 (-) Transcript_31594:404-778(-)
MEAFLQPLQYVPPQVTSPPAVAPAGVAPQMQTTSPVLSFGSGLTLGLLSAATVSMSGRRGRRQQPRQAVSMAVAVNEAANVKVGDAVPDVSLDLGFPPEAFKLKEFCKGKKVVLVGLPGAFTPT